MKLLVANRGEMAVRVAERLRRAVSEFVFNSDGKPLKITVSVGVATFPATKGLDSVDDLVRAADLAMYRAKDRGKNCVIAAEDDEPAA